MIQSHDCNNGIDWNTVHYYYEMYGTETITIKFNGESYPVKHIEINGNDVLVSVDTLSNALLNDGMPINKEAEDIDNTIFFYAPVTVFNQSIEKLQDFVNSNF